MKKTKHSTKVEEYEKALDSNGVVKDAETDRRLFMSKIKDVITVIIAAAFVVFVVIMAIPNGGWDEKENNASQRTDAGETVGTGFTFEHIGESGTFDFYRDLVTDVVYVRYREKTGYAGFGGVTVMLDPDTGLPLTYTRYLELSVAKGNS